LSTSTFIYLFLSLLSISALIYLGLSTWRLNQRVETLKLTVRQQELWTAFICHELRSPLFALKMQLSLLKSSNELAPTLHGHVDASLDASQQLLSMVSDILDEAQIRAGAFKLYPTLTNISEVARSVFNAYKTLAEEKGLCISFNVAPDTSQSVNLDAKRLRQVMINLVTNAIKYTQKGEIKLQIEAPLSHEIIFSVIDTGVGISKSEINKIFDPFYTSSQSAQETINFGVSQSSGLGLAIVKNIANASGWKIRVQSTTADENEKAKGSTFQLIIPLNR